MLRKASKALKEPHKAVRELHRGYWNFRGHTGIDVMAADWDNLIILDACRYDTFKELNTLDGSLTTAISRGSMTAEWLDENFDGQSYSDTIFVSGNPNLDNINAEFADIIRLWEDDWDDELGTARPESMVEKTLEAAARYPNKRLISMFVQPHIPFLGPAGRNISQHGFTGNGVVQEQRETKPVWHQLAAGEVPKAAVWDAYRENLELVLPHVDRLLSELSGRTVVSSDHGNAFGEKGVYGHPRGIYTKELIEVPWFTVDGGRREITEATETVSTGTQKSDVVEERLKDLGYR